MEKFIELNKTKEIICKILIIFSSLFFTFMVSNTLKVYKIMTVTTSYKYVLVGMLLSTIIIAFFLFKYVRIKKICKRKLLISFFVSLYFFRKIIPYTSGNFKYLSKFLMNVFQIEIDFSIISKIFGIFALIFVISIIYVIIDKFVPKIIISYKSLSEVEKKYLKIVLVFASIFTILIDYNTTSFTKPYYKNILIYSDVIYTTDTGALSNYNTFLNINSIENDIRQPLFGLLSLPFSISASFISEFCFFLPDDVSYIIVLTIIQFILNAITVVIFARMLKLEEKYKKYFFLLFSLSFPYILFSILLEQYVIANFYLVLAIYYYYITKGEKTNYIYLGAVGTLITSGIIFPLIKKIRNFKEYIVSCIKCFIAFISTMIISGQILQIIKFKDRLDMLLNNFATKISFTNKFEQFTYFINNLFFPTYGKIGMLREHMAYLLKNISDINFIGLLILMISITGFIINRKEFLAKLSMLWIIFSFIILCIIGWGTTENGLILYSLYFAWAYFVLIFLFFKRVFKSEKLFKIFISILILIMFISTLIVMIDIIGFSLRYYRKIL